MLGGIYICLGVYIGPWGYMYVLGGIYMSQGAYVYVQGVSDRGYMSWW